MRNMVNSVSPTKNKSVKAFTFLPLTWLNCHDRSSTFLPLFLSIMVSSTIRLLICSLLSLFSSQINLMMNVAILIIKKFILKKNTVFDSLYLTFYPIFFEIKWGNMQK